MNKLTVRRAVEADSPDLHRWRNDPLTREMSRNADPVGWSEHRRWFQASMASAERIILICEHPAIAEKVGMVRFDIAEADHNAEISINLAPSARGKGLAAACLIAAVARFRELIPECPVILATIKQDNHSSYRAFVRAGFEPLEETDGYWRLQCTA